MFIETIKTPGLAHLSYVVGDGEVAAVIDPRLDWGIYRDKARAHGARIRYILETHRNEDLLSGAAALAEATGAEVFHGPHADGAAACFIYGQFNGVQNDSGVFQGVPASAGETWEASVKVRPNPGDEPGEGNTATLSLLFLDGSGNVLSDNPVLAADHTTSSAMFHDVSVSATAPAGTAEAQIVLVYSQAEPLSDVNGDTVIDGGDQPTGAIIFDGANLALADNAGPCCDQNGDMVCSPADFSAWVANFNSGNLNADVNRDGVVSPADFSAWVASFNLGIVSGATCN